jgi:hypothetical protein
MCSPVSWRNAISIEGGRIAGARLARSLVLRAGDPRVEVDDALDPRDAGQSREPAAQVVELPHRLGAGGGARRVLEDDRHGVGVGVREDGAPQLVATT